MILDFGKGDTELEASVWTLVVYEQEFGSDMLGDLFGEVKFADDSGKFMVENGEVVGIDYSKFKWTTCVKALWAASKAANPDIAPFKDWAAKMKGINLFTVATKFVDELQKELFRPRAEASE